MNQQRWKLTFPTGRHNKLGFGKAVGRAMQLTSSTDFRHIIVSLYTSFLEGRSPNPGDLPNYSPYLFGLLSYVHSTTQCESFRISIARLRRIFGVLELKQKMIRSKSKFSLIDSKREPRWNHVTRFIHMFWLLQLVYALRVKYKEIYDKDKLSFREKLDAWDKLPISQPPYLWKYAAEDKVDLLIKEESQNSGKKVRWPTKRN